MEFLTRYNLSQNLPTRPNINVAHVINLPNHPNTNFAHANNVRQNRQNRSQKSRITWEGGNQIMYGNPGSFQPSKRVWTDPGMSTGTNFKEANARKSGSKYSKLAYRLSVSTAIIGVIMVFVLALNVPGKDYIVKAAGIALIFISFAIPFLQTVARNKMSNRPFTNDARQNVATIASMMRR